MTRYWVGWLALAGCLAFSGSAHACRVESYEASDVDGADLVVVGRISNYQLTPNRSFAESARKRVEDGTASSWERQKYHDVLNGIFPGGYYGKFDIAVDEVLKGDVGKTLSATYRPWTPCCFGPDQKELLPQQLHSQQYLIALHKPPTKVYFGGSADSDLHTVRINECIGPFLMKMPTWMVKDIKDYLAGQADAKH